MVCIDRREYDGLSTALIQYDSLLRVDSLRRVGIGLYLSERNQISRQIRAALKKRAFLGIGWRRRIGELADELDNQFLH